MAEPDSVPSVEREVTVTETAPERRFIQQAQYDTLAVMLYNGWQTEQIAKALGVEERSVKHFSSGKSKGFNAVMDAYRDRVVRVQVHHNQRLIEMMELGYDAVQDALAYNDGSIHERRLRAQTAFQLFDRVIPQEQKTAVNIEMTQNNLTVQSEIRQTHGMIAEKFGELLTMALNQDPKRHVLEGTEAIPSALPAPAPIDVDFTEETLGDA